MRKRTQGRRKDAVAIIAIVACAVLFAFPSAKAQNKTEAQFPMCLWAQNTSLAVFPAELAWLQEPLP